MARTKRKHTTKLPSQVDAGDKIILMGSSANDYKVMEVLEQPVRPEKGENWLIKTCLYPKGVSAQPTIRIPIVREDA